MSVLTSKRLLLLLISCKLLAGDNILNVTENLDLGLSQTFNDAGYSSRIDHNDSNFSVSTALLYWHVGEGATSWAATILLDPPAYDQASLSFGWDFGFRAGLGYRLNYDQWDTKLYYTWFRTEAADTAEVSSPEIGGISSYFLGGYIELPRSIFHSAHLQWSVLFNMFDWELGRHFLVKKTLMLRPWVGAKGGWIHQTIHSQWRAHDGLRAQENLKNNFWGLGPSGGFNSEWRLSVSEKRFFSFFNNLSCAYLWGKWNCSDVYFDTYPAQVTVNTPGTMLGALAVTAFSGIGWSITFNRERSRFSARLGYELQYWFNQLKIVTFNELRLSHDLTLQGGTCDLSFNF